MSPRERVGSYPTISTLPVPCGHRRYTFCCTCPGLEKHESSRETLRTIRIPVGVTDYPFFRLSTEVFGLSSLRQAQGDCLAYLPITDIKLTIIE